MKISNVKSIKEIKELNENSLENKVKDLQRENELLKQGLEAVLRGDMQELAYILYPKDFKNINVLDNK